MLPVNEYWKPRFYQKGKAKAIQRRMVNRIIAHFTGCHGHFWNFFYEPFQTLPGPKVGSLRRVTLLGMLINCLRRAAWNPEIYFPIKWICSYSPNPATYQVLLNSLKHSHGSPPEDSCFLIQPCAIQSHGVPAVASAPVPLLTHCSPHLPG